MSNFTGHEELQRVDRSSVVSKIDESLVHNLGPGFGCDVAAKIDINSPVIL